MIVLFFLIFMLPVLLVLRMFCAWLNFRLVDVFNQIYLFLNILILLLLLLRFTLLLDLLVR